MRIKTVSLIVWFYSALFLTMLTWHNSTGRNGNSNIYETLRQKLKIFNLAKKFHLFFYIHHENPL